MIGVFLALLELIREKKILVQQDDVLDDMEIVPAPEEHRRTYAGASLHLADEMEPPDDIAADESAAEDGIDGRSAEESARTCRSPRMICRPRRTRRRARGKNFRRDCRAPRKSVGGADGHCRHARCIRRTLSSPTTRESSEARPVRRAVLIARFLLLAGPRVGRAFSHLPAEK